MSVWIVPPVAGLIEPAVAPEFHVDSIGAIELTHGCVRIVLCSEQMPLEAGGARPAKVVQVKIIGPAMGVPQVIGQLAQCLLWRSAPLRQPIMPPLPPQGGRPHLVR